MVAAGGGELAHAFEWELTVRDSGFLLLWPRESMSRGPGYKPVLRSYLDTQKEHPNRGTFKCRFSVMQFL